MKKHWLSIAFVCFAIPFMGSSQNLKIESVSKLALPENVVAEIATISPDGTNVIISDIAANNLKQFECKTENIKAIPGTESVYDVKFTPDGKQIVFRKNSFDSDKLRYQNVVALNLNDNSTVELTKPSRELSGFNISSSNVVALDGKTTKKIKTNKAGASTEISVGIDRGDLIVYDGKETKVINPQGERSYLWPQLSPDETRIVYWGDGIGCHVCNIDGSNPILIGRLHDAKWLDNETIIGMNDYDDGNFITESSIVAVRADGTSGQRLTGNEFVAIYPTVSADGNSIAFTDPKGNAYIIKIERTK